MRNLTLTLIAVAGIAAAAVTINNNRTAAAAQPAHLTVDCCGDLYCPPICAKVAKKSTTTR